MLLRTTPHVASEVQLSHGTAELCEAEHAVNFPSSEFRHGDIYFYYIAVARPFAYSMVVGSRTVKHRPP